MEATKQSTIVDTSVLVAAFNDEDALHKRAVKVMDDCPKPFILHEYVVLETATVLMSRINKQAADDFLDMTLTNADSRVLHSSAYSFLKTIDSFTESKTKQLSFTDAALLSLSDQYSVLTFDDALNRAIKRKANN